MVGGLGGPQRRREEKGIIQGAIGSLHRQKEAEAVGETNVFGEQELEGAEVGRLHMCCRHLARRNEAFGSARLKGKERR